MQAITPLFRQVHPNWIKEDGVVASISFLPFPKDEALLSVDDGDRVTPRASWERYVAQANCSSGGVWAATVEEAAQIDLPSRENPVEGNPEHAVIDFSAFTEKQQKAKAKLLSSRANIRGCLFAPIP
jgi:hypothetical protein